MEEVSEKKGKAPEKWEIEGWADTLIRANEIKADKKKMDLVRPFLSKKLKAIRSIADLEERAKLISKEEADD